MVVRCLLVSVSKLDQPRLAADFLMSPAMACADPFGPVQCWDMGSPSRDRVGLEHHVSSRRGGSRVRHFKALG
jgi:hypothetical protein